MLILTLYLLLSLLFKVSQGWRSHHHSNGCNDRGGRGKMGFSANTRLRCSWHQGIQGWHRLFTLYCQFIHIKPLVAPHTQWIVDFLISSRGNWFCCKKKSQIDVCEKMFLLFTWFVSLSTYQVKFVYKDDHKGTMGLSYYCGCTFSVSFNFSSALYWLRDGVWGEIRLMTFILYWPCCSADICNTGELNISIWIEFSPANRLCRYLWSS